MEHLPTKLREDILKADWFGGYAPIAYTDDGGALCHNCVSVESVAIQSAYPGDGWYIAAVESSSMVDESLTCDHCNVELCPYV